MSDSGYLMQTALPYGLHGLNDASFVQYTHALLVSVRSPLFLPLYAIVPVLGAEAATLWHVRVLVCSGGALVPCPVDTEPVRRASTDVRLRSCPTPSVWSDAAARAVEAWKSVEALTPGSGLASHRWRSAFPARAVRSQRLPCICSCAFPHRALCGPSAHTNGIFCSCLLPDSLTDLADFRCSWFVDLPH